jgi:hypothetical protein
MILTAKRHKKLAASVLLGALALGGAVGYEVTRNSAQIDTVQQAVVKACETSLKPGGVRYILAAQIEQQIVQSSSFDAAQFFPNVPPKTLHRLINAQVKQERREINQLRGINCSAQYR